MPDIQRLFFHVDILDDGETLKIIPDASSQDFVIANHFLEHCEDPLGALDAMTRVVNAFAHLLRDHQEGPA